MSVLTNFVIFRGEDKSIVFSMQPPTDITGWAITFTARSTIGSAVNPYFVKDNGSNGSLTLTDAKAGVFTVTLARSDTLNLNAPINIPYDVRRSDAGNAAILAHGSLYLRAEQTQ